MRLRRSCLSVPGNQSPLHKKADHTNADEIFLDLEDSVPALGKGEARTQVVTTLNTIAYEGKVRSVRINSCDTIWCHDDLIELVEGAGARLDCIILPKVESVDEVHFVDQLLTQLEKKQGLSRRIGLELQIESALGLENAGQIAAASDRNEALIFGPADLSVSMRMPAMSGGIDRAAYPGDFWHYFLVRVLVAARAHGLQAVDGPYARIRDGKGLADSAVRTAMLGYDGKWALNPFQVDILNGIYMPSQLDFERACLVVATYEGAVAKDGVGAMMLGDEMIDEASRKLASVVVERGLALGMKPTAT